MQLKITRSQRQTALAKTAVFIIDARVEFTAEELALVNKYKLGGQVIYNSAASRRHLEKADRREDGTTLGSLKSLASVAMAILQLNISVNSLQRGQHIECKDMDEVLSAEEALMIACRNLRSYLDLAATFDGREVIIDFSGPEPVAVPTRTPELLPPSAPIFGAPPQPALIESSQSMPIPSMRPADAGSSSAINFDDVLLRVQRFWDRATPITRVLVIVAAVVVLVLLYNIL